MRVYNNIIWLKFSDSLCGLTDVHGGTVDQHIDVDVEIAPGAYEWLTKHLIYTGYGENLPNEVIDYLRTHGWVASPEDDRDNGYVSASAFRRGFV